MGLLGSVWFDSTPSHAWPGWCLYSAWYLFVWCPDREDVCLGWSCDYPGPIKKWERKEVAYPCRVLSLAQAFLSVRLTGCSGCLEVIKAWELYDVRFENTLNTIIHICQAMDMNQTHVSWQAWPAKSLHPLRRLYPGNLFSQARWSDL